MDLPTLTDTLIRISERLTVCHEIAEADLNPSEVVDNGHGVCVVYVRARIQGSEESASNGKTQRSSSSSRYLLGFLLFDIRVRLRRKEINNAQFNH